MNIYKLLEEYNLEIDDVRWYLAKVLSESLLGYKDRPRELIQLIWSGKLASSLHDMEEGYLAELQDKLDRELTDEATVREILREMTAAGTGRR